MKYTPAPWIIKHEFNIVSQTGRLVAGCGGHQQNFNEDDNRNENMANAQLISASPDMYEALKNMINIFDRGLLIDSFGRRICDEAIAALNKADGKKSKD